MTAKERLEAGNAVDVLVDDDLVRGTVVAVLGERVRVRLANGNSETVDRELVERADEAA